LFTPSDLNSSKSGFFQTGEKNFADSVMEIQSSGLGQSDGNIQKWRNAKGSEAKGVPLGESRKNQTTNGEIEGEKRKKAAENEIQSKKNYAGKRQGETYCGR